MKSLQDVSPDTLKGSLLHRIVSDLRTKETQIVFTDATPAPAAGLLLVELTLEVRDADGDKVSVSDEDVPEKAGIREIQVDITGGTATGKQLQTKGPAAAVDASLITRFVDGKAVITVIATSTGTVILGLTDSGGTGLTVTSISTVTLS